MPSVSLEMHEQSMKGMRETEDINTHHLLQQHLYKGRKQVSILSHIAIHPQQCYSYHLRLIPYSTGTGTAAVILTSTGTKMRCRRSFRGP